MTYEQKYLYVDYIDKENKLFFQLSVGNIGYKPDYSSFEVFSQKEDFIELALSFIDCFMDYGMRKPYSLSFSDKASEVLGEKRKELLEDLVWLKRM